MIIEDWSEEARLEMILFFEGILAKIRDGDRVVEFYAAPVRADTCEGFDVSIRFHRNGTPE